jgi:hypothetical protein
MRTGITRSLRNTKVPTLVPKIDSTQLVRPAISKYPWHNLWEFRALNAQPATRIEDKDDDEYENDKGQRVTHAISPSRQTPNAKRYPAR